MGKDLAAGSFEHENLSQLEKQVAKLVPSRQRISIGMLLNPGDENNCIDEGDDINVVHTGYLNAACRLFVQYSLDNCNGLVEQDLLQIPEGCD